ncbi:glutamyl-tRNA reductase [Methanosarcina thermophila]|uniref:Glutamyl-tRNA reductase n=1 Tax=Methanosarcina thermophila TaxID=2210 RepID=A0A1I6YSZ8_METTE|nr:glutamyl-tRNA reductase [Methanosarcina thermophila]ALK06590.1 MAG: glutamyl-tRNA reductase [Methanosarcina sp. 795]NLU58211.1 glutamyl-tRNA reductase [Methanosarcina thermophila]SFT53563.1 glutamyl-tRNA reductase [Methanosarcina thermophila]BAW28883.1 glutamyl-tRNA reductase [Methanosarcina thermophila]GLI14651.1 glutamyl-tRNA reductase [Methanosarcina thermophila MST-A1]
MTEISSMVISHKKAKIEEMESAWHGDLDGLLHSLYNHEYVHECVVLKTCNRVEIYVVSPKSSSVLFSFAKEMGASTHIIDFYGHDESLEHLLRLAGGLESMIVGEDQILGQIKELYAHSKKAGTTGKILDTAFEKAIQVGKRIRNETKINKGSVSIGSAAVDLAEEILKGLTGKSVLVIGAGEIGVLVAKALAEKDIEAIYIANRTFKKAEELAYELGGHAVRFDDIQGYLKDADVVISGTSAPHYVLTREMVENAICDRDKARKLLLIDIANPRDIEESVSELENVELCNIDNLRVISERTLKMRKEEAKKAEAIIQEEIRLLNLQYKRQKADRIISELYKQMYDVRIREREKAVNRLGAYHTIGKIETEVLDDLTRSIVNKILAEPTKVLRQAAELGNEEFLDVASRIFCLDKERAKVEKIKPGCGSQLNQVSEEATHKE